MKKLKIKLFQKSMNLKTMNNAYYGLLDFFKGDVNKIMFLCRAFLLLIVRDIIIAITLVIVTIR